MWLDLALMALDRDPYGAIKVEETLDFVARALSPEELASAQSLAIQCQESGFVDCGK